MKIEVDDVSPVKRFRFEDQAQRARYETFRARKDDYPDIDVVELTKLFFKRESENASLILSRRQSIYPLVFRDENGDTHSHIFADNEQHERCKEFLKANGHDGSGAYGSRTSVNTYKTPHKTTKTQQTTKKQSPNKHQHHPLKHT